MPLSNRFAIPLVMCAAMSFSAPASADQSQTASIATDENILTMVNVLTPQPGKQDAAIRLLQAGMSDEMSAQPGFISSTIHRSLNSDHIVVYAQWRDQASVNAAVEVIQSGGAPNMTEVFAIASPDFHPYDVESVHSAQDD